MYPLTARHLVAGLPLTAATINVWQGTGWRDYKTVRTLFPPDPKVDVAVFETHETVAKPYTITPPNADEGVALGAQVWFLGFPHGLGSRNSSGLAFCFIKGGTMSAIDSTDPHAVLLYVDGFNNEGFSGGPIIYFDPTSHAFRILGVVRGYEAENAKTVINGIEQNTNVLVNSGIMVGYSIEHAIQAITNANAPK